MNRGLFCRSTTPVQPAGFTIIEVLIVLAVSGFMLTSAILLINGKQNNTAFNQSIRNVQSELQQVIIQVSTSSYTSSDNIKCESLGGVPKLTTAIGTIDQGTNEACIFLGKALHFAIGSNPEKYNIYTIAGIRKSISLDPFTAKARVIAPGTLTPLIPDVHDVNQLQYGLTVVKMYYDGKPANKIGAVALVTAASNLGVSDGSQQVDVIALRNTSVIPQMSEPVGVDKINSNWTGAADGGVTNPEGGVQICFRSGATEQSGLVSIGAASRQESVELKIFNSVDCT